MAVTSNHPGWAKFGGGVTVFNDGSGQMMNMNTLNVQSRRLTLGPNGNVLGGGWQPYTPTWTITNELDLRDKSIESLDDFLQLLRRVQQAGHKINDVIVTPEQRVTLLASTSNQLLTNIKTGEHQLYGKRLVVGKPLQLFTS